MKFQASAPEHRFDFVFDQFSKDAPAPAAVTTMNAPGATGEKPASGSAAPIAPGSSGSGRPAGSAPELETITPADAGLMPVAIAETVPEMLQQLRTRNERDQGVHRSRRVRGVCVPAFQAKDVALALDAKKTGLPQERQRMVGPAVDRIVRTAYLLDAFGDLGNKQQISDAYATVRRGRDGYRSRLPETAMRLIGRSLLAAAGAGLVAAIAMPVGEAHKPITSKYTFNDDVFPILKERCAQCHVAGGVAPMSLMTYEEAFPWAESIRAELVASHMPPATADGRFGDVTHARGLTPQEIDVLLTWASGGNPRGAIDQKLPAVGLKNDWALGKPDTVLQQPAEFTLTADKMEDSQAFSVPTGLTEPRWVRVVDLLPGNPAIVHQRDDLAEGLAGTNPRAMAARPGFAPAGRGRCLPPARRRRAGRADSLQEDVVLRRQGDEGPQQRRPVCFARRPAASDS